MDIKSFPLITTVSPSDYFLVQTAVDGAYKSILASDLQSFFESSSSNNPAITPINFVFLSSFNTIIDAIGHTIQVAGNPVISTSQSIFNGSSLYFDESSYLSLSPSQDWNLSTGDFTITSFVEVIKVLQQPKRGDV